MTKNININLLIPFENHSFKKRDGIEQSELVESIAQNGLLEPITVRSFPAGKYEIISGHRRVKAYKELGITEVPATIKEIKKLKIKILKILQIMSCTNTIQPPISPLQITTQFPKPPYIDNFLTKIRNRSKKYVAKNL